MRNFKSIGTDSLVAQQMEIYRERAVGSCYDEDGVCDVEDLDHTLDGLEQDDRAMEEDCDVLSVYASEVLRLTA